MGKKEEILEYCTKKNEQLTAREIVDALYPGKAQSYVNTVINKLVEENKTKHRTAVTYSKLLVLTISSGHTGRISSPMVSLCTSLPK